MAKVIADITMSIDGFVTGPDPDLEHGLGHGGEPQLEPRRAEAQARQRMGPSEQ